MKNFNINNYVRIKLTPLGMKILKEKHKELRKYDKGVGKFVPSEQDEDGYCSMQLWQVMAIFGAYMNAYDDAPFNMDIRIDDKYLT